MLVRREMSTTGDELYRRMVSRQPDSSGQAEPTYEELLDVLKQWVVWTKHYGPLIGAENNTEFLHLCELSIDILSRNHITDIE